MMVQCGHRGSPPTADLPSSRETAHGLSHASELTKSECWSCASSLCLPFLQQRAQRPLENLCPIKSFANQEKARARENQRDGAIAAAILCWPLHQPSGTPPLTAYHMSCTRILRLPRYGESTPH